MVAVRYVHVRCSDHTRTTLLHDPGMLRHVQCSTVSPGADGIGGGVMTTTQPSPRDVLRVVEVNDAGTAEQVATVDTTPTYMDRLQARMLSGLDICNLPPPEWIVQDVIQTPGVGMLYGPPKVGKSFVAIDLACSVATGRPWLGKQVARPGRVLYVVAENVGAFGQRLAAWADYHGADGLERVTWLTGAVNLTTDEAVAAMCSIVQGYDLVIFDTLARCAVGLEENSARDMGLLVDAVDRIRDACGGHVLLVHHAGKDGTQKARGSSALLGAVNVSIRVSGGDYVTVAVEDSNNSESGHSVRYSREPVGDALVLVEGPAPSLDRRPPKNQDLALDCLRAIAGPGGVSNTEWRAQCEDQGIPLGSFQRLRKWLVARGDVVNLGTDSMPKYVPADASDGPGIADTY